jgi:hypothetical protein
MSRQAHEWLKPSVLEQGRGGRLPLTGFSGFGWPIDGWYLVTRHVYHASMHSTIVPRMERHAYLPLNETVLAVSSHN